MSFLTYARDERVVVVGLTAAFVGVVATMRVLLQQWRDGTEIKPQQPTTQYITQETEDSLRPSTLDMLLGHYNFAIREVAAKIVCDRAVNDGETIDYLLWGITRPDYDERMKNLRTLAFITDPRMSYHRWYTGKWRKGRWQYYRAEATGHPDGFGMKSLSKLNTTRAYSAFVRSLEHCLADRAPLEKLDDRWFDEYGLRDMAEKLCFMFISQLMQKYGPDRFIQAGIVEKWLAKQNWGDKPEEREHNFFQYMYKTNRIVEIIQKIQQSAIGRDALEKAGLMPKTVSQSFDVFASIHIETEILDGDNAEPTPRNLEQSPEEQRIRHRHREAMVLNDGTRPLGRSDIIEREHHTPPP